MIINRSEFNALTGETTVYDIELQDKTLDEHKVDKKNTIKQAFINESIKPIVNTGLGFSVDGGYQNKTDFETGKKYSFPQVRASDNTMHNVTLADYDTIISAIEMNGISLYQKKWQLEAQIDACTAVAEVEVIQW